MDDTLKRWLFDPVVGRLVYLAVGLIVLRVGVALTQRSLTRRVEDSGLRYRTRKAVTLAGYVAAFLLAGAVYSERLGSFTVAFGVAGAGIAFALQEVIASIAGWLAVSFAEFYRPGDRIQLGGIRGDVIDVGVLRTTLMECGEWVKADQYNGRIVRVANSFVFKEPVYNYSAHFPFLWDEIMVPIKYGSDYHMARALLESVAHEVVGDYARQAEGAWREVVRQFLIEDARIAPLVTLQANQNWIELTLRYIVGYKDRRVTKDRLFTRVLEEIDATNGRVGIAASTLNIEKLPPLEVHLADELKVRQAP
ncbi:MAG TPA: mechanosensitive ion channel [Vicinamibacterales bacterium]|nr:mechanosensitive ion channel [Vicinamibacterales bacterium]